MQQFDGSTIHRKAANGAYVVKREVEGRRTQLALRARHEELRRQARRDALLRPFRRVLQLLRRRRESQGAASPAAPPPKSRRQRQGLTSTDEWP